MPIYPRKEQEKYGESTVELVEINMSDNTYETLDVDGKNVILPVLNLKKYDPNYHCYMFIERLKSQPITMVDLLYSYKEIDFDDENTRNSFLETFSRDHINLVSMKWPGMIAIPNDNSVRESFIKTMKSALQDSIGNKLVMVKGKKREQISVEKAKKEEETITPDTIRRMIHEFLGGAPEEDGPQIINLSLKQEAIFIKTGEIIIRGIQNSKYLVNYRNQTKIDNGKDTLKDMLAVYITGMDDVALTTDSEYCKKFGKTILSSYMLETLSSINVNKLPRFEYIGSYNQQLEKIEANIQIESRFDKLNEIMNSKDVER